MKDLKADEIRQIVRKQYGDIAISDPAGCGCGPTSCCGPESDVLADKTSKLLGYSQDEVAAVPEGANMGLGCGNPQAIAALKPDEVVLDLGSGGGFDCFLAARAVGSGGRVIGIDMTPDMISKARANALKGGFDNVEFRLGEIEHIPASDNSIDVIISNCVINLSPSKQDVYDDAFRVLKPGGRIAISDIVATAEIPEAVQNDIAMYVGCVAGASLIDDVEQMLGKAGFTEIRVEPKTTSKEVIREWTKEFGLKEGLENFVVSAVIEALKP